MTSALDMPEIMSYIYSKSWKLQFSASSSIIIIEDYYLQTFLHSLRNASIRKKVLALAGYEFIVFLLFLWIFIVCIIFTEFDYESIIAIVQWELKWILYFTISIILQFAMYYFFWKKSKILKIVTLLFSLIIVIVPLHVFDFT